MFVHGFPDRRLPIAGARTTRRRRGRRPTPPRSGRPGDRRHPRCPGVAVPVTVKRLAGNPRSSGGGRTPPATRTTRSSQRRPAGGRNAADGRRRVRATGPGARRSAGGRAGAPRGWSRGPAVAHHQGAVAIAVCSSSCPRNCTRRDRRRTAAAVLDTRSRGRRRGAGVPLRPASPSAGRRGACRCRRRQHDRSGRRCDRSAAHRRRGPTAAGHRTLPTTVASG